jgi:hypothetical protein
MRYLICAAAMALLLLTPARAEMALMGVGAVECSTFNERYRDAPDLAETTYFAWAQGFMSGMNARSITQDGTSQDMSSKPVEAQESFLRKYCSDHPRASYVEGVLTLYRQFRPNRPLRR